jgi:hypothetical protein
MGHASQTKRARREYARQRPELLRVLGQQYEMLVTFGGAFDSGQAVAAFPLAVVIRVVVHDTPKSHALLVQLGERDRVRFRDTALPINPANLLTMHAGLTIMRMTMGTGSSWVPRLVAPSAPGAPLGSIRFGAWWDGSIVLRDTHSVTWTRQNVVLDLANREGGAHVDPMRPEDLKALEEDNSMGWTHSDSITGDGQPMLNGPLLPSVRQIAYELQVSLESHFGALLHRPVVGV